jgi:hypothetical protein
MWARIHLIPALQAEEDRDQVRRYLADKAREKELLGSETRVYNSDRYVILGRYFNVFLANKSTTGSSDRPSQSPQSTRQNKASDHRHQNSYGIVHTREKLAEKQTPPTLDGYKHVECNVVNFPHSCSLFSVSSLSKFHGCQNSVGPRFLVTTSGLCAAMLSQSQVTYPGS